MRTVGWIVSVVFVLLSGPSIASTQVAAPANMPAGPVADELPVLKAQLATTREYQDQFLSVVQWSLGAVLAMALGLAAFNWYSSKTSYERDIASLRQENSALHAELTALIQTETGAIVKRLTEALSGRQAEIQTAVAKILDQKLAKQASDISGLRNDVLALQFDLTEREAKEAAAQRNYSWAIYKYCDLLDLSVKNGSDHYQVGEILDAIGKLLDRPEISLSADIVTKAVEHLKLLPQRYQAAAQNLIPRINRAQR